MGTTATLRYEQTSAEKKKYVFDYTDFLDTGETITMLAYAVSDAALVMGEGVVEASGQVAYFFVSGGVSGNTYKASLISTTSAGQIIEDTIIVVVKDP